MPAEKNMPLGMLRKRKYDISLNRLRVYANWVDGR